MQLSELEEGMDQRIQAAEHKTRKDEERKAEEALSDLRRQYKTAVRNLQVTTMKLEKLEEQLKHVSQKEDVAVQKKQIYNLLMENLKIKKDLLEAQRNIAFLQSELDALKRDYADQNLISERWEERVQRCPRSGGDQRRVQMFGTDKTRLGRSDHTTGDLEVMRECMEDRNSLLRQIEKLQTDNRKLQDSNDGLRSALENTASSTDPRSSRSFYVNEDCDSPALCDPMQRMNCEVNSLPESCFDSGLSTVRDSNEYDSELEYRPQRAFQRSHGTQESFAGDASVTDTAIVDDGKAYRIVLAGDAGVGKTSFLMRLCENKFRRITDSTVGVDFQMKTLLVDGERTVLRLWDTAGEERFRSIAKSYFRRADGVLLLYDVTREKSFQNVQEWVDMIEDATTENIPIMLVGNKADLRNAAAAEGQKCVPRYCGEKLAMTYGALFCETSVKDGSYIMEAVLRLAREVKKRTKEDDSKSIINLTVDSSKQSTRKKSCCKR